MTIEHVVGTMEEVYLEYLINSYNENEGKDPQEKIIEVYEKALSAGYTPKEARILIEAKLVVSQYQIRKFIPKEARRRRQRTPGKFFPSRGLQQ